MNDHQIHRLYRHFQELPFSMCVLFTSTLMVLGLGYAFAALYVFAAHAGADGRPGLSVEDIKITYSGDKKATQLESALKGPMSGMMSPDDLAEMIAWINTGADKRAFESEIEPIVDENCLSCHDGSNPHLSNLDGYENIQKVVSQDTGVDLYTLVRVSHIHLFGLTFIFFIVGFIFSYAYVRPLLLKRALIIAPFAGVTIDVLGWYVTKVFTPFAWGVLIAGVINGLSFAAMWSISLYQMWIYKVPDHVRLRRQVEMESGD